MGAPASRGNPEIPEQGALPRAAPVPEGGVPTLGAASGKRGGRRTSVGGSRPHDVVDPTEGLGGPDGRVHQGKERDPHRAEACGPAAEPPSRSTSGLEGTSCRFNRRSVASSGGRLRRRACLWCRDAMVWRPASTSGSDTRPGGVAILRRFAPTRYVRSVLCDDSQIQVRTPQ